jgi:hypothetical protein
MNERRGAVLAVLAGGFAAGTLDIVYAILWSGMYGRSAEWVLQSVASGWLGMAAFEGGTAAAALGLASHYGILFVAAWLYLAASARLPVLRTQAVACGALFGVAIYLFMNFVVLPMSAFPFKPAYPWLVLLRGFASHAIVAGIPIALAVRRFAGPRAVLGLPDAMAARPA